MSQTVSRAYAETYSFPKTSEGGMGQAHAKHLAVEAGAERVEWAVSPFMGHTALRITATREAHRAIEAALFA